jgi:hypothetical protein
MKINFLYYLSATFLFIPFQVFSQQYHHQSIEVMPPTGVRLGNWLTAHHPDLSSKMYAPGLVWIDPDTQESQKIKKKNVLIRLSALRNQSPVSIDNLTSLLDSLPITGRLALPLQDAWLMQAHKNLEPVMNKGSKVIFSARPDRVKVINAESKSCDVYFQHSRWAADYLQSCGHDFHSDEVWLIQADGQVSHVQTGIWNQKAQASPAPGAWIWQPHRDLSADLQFEIAQIMASQGPALGTGPAKYLPETYHYPKNLKTHLNDWGISGLLQTPSARTASAGHAGITISRVWPYTHTTLTVNPFDSIEIGLRYTDISNRLYGPLIAGDQSYKDKSAEIKWRVTEETKSRPAVAIGLRDPGGTGLFAGEYVVASKRFDKFDLNLGIGWGYLGHHGDFKNPLRMFGSKFSERQKGETGEGGTTQLGPTFTGNAALFGGIQWQTPIPELVIKIEHDGNNYRNEPLSNDIGGAKTRINWGMTWQKGPLSLSLGQERGKQWMAGLTVRTDLSQLTRVKSSEPASWSVTKPFHGNVNLDSTPYVIMDSKKHTILIPNSKQFLLDEISKQAGWLTQHLHEEVDSWTIDFDNTHGFSLPDRIDRAASVVHAYAPDQIRFFKFNLRHQGVLISSRQIDRALWAHERFAWRGHAPLHRSVATATTKNTSESPLQRPSGSFSLGYQQHLGGPDGYLYAVSASAKGHWKIRNGVWFQGSANMRLNDNYDKFQYTAPSALPRVRTHIREYLTGERLTLPNLQINHLHQLQENIYSLFYAGALESMFAGAGAEIMWRPIDSKWAIGVDLNQLVQRDFDQRFRLRDYRVSSGHITAHLDTKWQGIEGKLSVGQYLAGDRGLTIELGKRFNNGARMGAWVTKTNVPSKNFGEGSFDKGVFISLPFDNFVTGWSTRRAHFAWQPLIRDGGAKLNRSQTLWNLTRSRDSREWGGLTQQSR